MKEKKNKEKIEHLYVHIRNEINDAVRSSEMTEKILNRKKREGSIIDLLIEVNTRWNRAVMTIPQKLSKR